MILKKKICRPLGNDKGKMNKSCRDPISPSLLAPFVGINFCRRCGEAVSSPKRVGQGIYWDMGEKKKYDQNKSLDIKDEKNNVMVEIRRG